MIITAMDLQLQDMEVNSHMEANSLMEVNSRTGALVMDNLATAHHHPLATM